MQQSFRTLVDIKPFPFGLDYNTPSLFIGSCFTENIGSKMRERKFSVLVNPFGVVYNPLSALLVLNRIIDGKPYSETDLSFHNNLWLSLDHHTSFSNTDKNQCLSDINVSLEKSHAFWKNTQCLAITFGTARTYYQNKTNLPVANCHKIPAKEFTNKLLTVNEILSTWTDRLKKIIADKPNIKIIFTVSPVRHWKDGAIGNQVSKSTLILAIKQLTDTFPNNAFYFPAYEIMMDDLRDYRYYADDMLHPTPLAVNYIWDKFKLSLIHSTAQKQSQEIEKIIQAINHKPFNPNTLEHKKFIENTLGKIEDVIKSNPTIDFNDEISKLKLLQI
jgi:hypothetical protein